MTERAPYNAPITEYQAQADALLAAWRAGEEHAVRFFWQQHPRFRRPDVLWLPKQLEKSDVLKEEMTADDARLAIARWYDLRDWDALSEWVAAVTDEGSSVRLFETAVEAVIDGDEATLKRLLQEHP